VSGAENGVERAENRVSGRGAWSGRPLSGSAAQSGCHEDRFERWAANRPLTLRSAHMPCLRQSPGVVVETQSSAVERWPATDVVRSAPRSSVVTTMSMRSGPSPAQRQYRAVYEPIQFTRIIHIITYLPNASTITTKDEWRRQGCC